MNGKIKRILRFLYYFPSTGLNRMQYVFKHVRVGAQHETKGRLFIKNGGTISIGHHVRINSSPKANPIGVGTKTFLQVLPKGKLHIGDYTRMSNVAITVAEKVVIGNHVRIGSGVRIYDTDFHSLNPYHRTAVPECGEIKTKEIFIEDYAFIGAGSYILKGVHIGKGAVIGAGSVVTRDVPDFEIWAGNPACRIKSVDGIV